MANLRIFILIVSIALGVVFWRGLEYFFPANSTTTHYLATAALAVIFLGMLISNQQYEEDVISKAERIISALLFSYLVFFGLMYAPLHSFFFGTLVAGSNFPTDLLRLFLFSFFGLLFAVSFVMLNSFARFGFLSGLKIFNNSLMFFALRIIFFAALGAFYVLHVRSYIYG